MVRAAFTVRVDIPIQVGDLVRVNDELMKVVKVEPGDLGINVEAVTVDGPVTGVTPVYELRDTGARADALLEEVLKDMDGLQEK